MPPVGTTGAGFAAGDVVPDHTLVDQFGADVALWQFSGRVTVLVMSTMWAAPAQQLSDDLTPPPAAWSAEPVSVVTVLHQNVDGDPPTAADLTQYTSTYSIDGPVLADASQLTATAVHQGYPTVLVIGPDLIVRTRVEPPTLQAILPAVQAVLDE